MRKKAEESGEEFACKSGREAHACGHDFHAAMLLTAAKMLKEREDSLQELIARESDPEKSCVLTIGKFEAGTAANIIPDTAVLEGTLRTNDTEERAKLVKRIRDVAKLTAEVYGGQVQIEELSNVPPLICDSNLTTEMLDYMRELSIPGFTEYPDVTASASEDFANIAELVPSTFMYLSAGFLDERGAYSAHHPKVRFNEEVCPIGAACLAHCASRWLEEHGNAVVA